MDPIRTYYTLKDSKEYGFKKDSIIYLTRKEAEMLVAHKYIIPLHVAIRLNLKKDNAIYIPPNELKKYELKTQPKKIKKTRRKKR